MFVLLLLFVDVKVQQFFDVANFQQKKAKKNRHIVPALTTLNKNDSANLILKIET
jgi:hypothetical protein